MRKESVITKRNQEEKLKLEICRFVELLFFLGAYRKQAHLLRKDENHCG